MISIIIPVYRSAESLSELHRRLADVFDARSQALEILFIEDCGGDDSWDVIKRLSQGDQRVRGFRMSRNYGQHNALLCGIRAARGDVIVTMDDDLQHPPEELPKLLAKLDEGFDVVYGLRSKNSMDCCETSPRDHQAHTAGGDGRGQCEAGERLAGVSDATPRGLAGYRSPTVNIDVLLTWGGTRFAAVPIRHEPRKFGESGYTTGKLIRHALNMMTGFSTRPLQIASLIGFGFALFGFVLLAYILIRWLQLGSTVPGFAFLACMVAIFSGVQLLAIGIIGEYLARIHFRTMDRPPYAVRDQT